MATLVDDGDVRQELEAAKAGAIVTRKTGIRWAAALADLERRVASARRAGGSTARVAGRAAELATVASEMFPRVERATKVATELQATVDRLDAEGRDFRASLGNAIDVLVHDRSRERAHLDAVRARRASGESSGPWEHPALDAEERRVDGLVADLGFQIDTLQKQLDLKNDEHERAVLSATARLEGALSALRALDSEIGGAIEEAVEMLAVAS
jgi:hypothetical protein